MAGIGRATFFFKQGESGFTESFTFPYATGLFELRDPVKRYRKQRVELLQNNVQLHHAIITDTAVFRDSELIETPTGEAFGTYDFKADMPWTCVLVRCSSGTKYRKSIYLRGVPDSELETDAAGQTVLKPAYKDLVVKRLRAGIIDGSANSWGFLARDQEPTVPSNPALGIYGYIKAMTKIAGGVIQVETFAAHNIQPLVPTRVNFTRAKGTVTGLANPLGGTKINGIHIVRDVIDATNFTLQDTCSDIDYRGQGFFKWHSLKHFPITDINVMRVGKHETGPSFTSPHGRRPNRAA